MRFAPGVDGDFDVGAVAGIGADCVHWTARWGGEVVVPPVEAWLADGTLVRLDPLPIVLPPPVPSQDNSDPVDTPCAGNEEQVGPVCAQVSDDRVTLTTSVPWLVGFDFTNSAHVSVVEPDAGWVVRSLPPLSTVRGRSHAVSVSGEHGAYELEWTTTAPIERVVINEVMAHPVGPEPQQEWVELYNDGTIDVDLAGWHFDDVGGHLALPSATLVPGQFALLVGEDYDPTSWMDTHPVDGTMLIRVPVVGKGGLSNAGEPIRLTRANGSVASSVPGIASKYAGGSIARLRPEELDVLRSFFVDRAGGTPGYANRIP